MQILKKIVFNNFRNLKNAILKDLRDLNIIIGPNNCGKTSLLRGIELLQNISFSKDYSLLCGTCRAASRIDDSILGANLPIAERDKYLLKSKTQLDFYFNMDEIAKIYSEIIKNKDKIVTPSGPTPLATLQELRSHTKEEVDKVQLILKERSGRKLSSEHASVIADHQVKERIFDHMLFCPDDRLQSYKKQNFQEFIGSKDFGTTENMFLLNLLRDMIDPTLVDMRHSLKLVKKFAEGDFDTAIEEQGSGVKSLICLAADILAEKQVKILLIDEPELGLNPSSKHAFLKFLMNQFKEKQIFLATHDPTFVNPILWTNENVSVYLFSLVDRKFVKVNLSQNEEDPDTFAGYLPHTTSLKQIHVYVEGSLDVYIFQAFLHKYVKGFFQDWYRIINKIGIYHLGGDFWSHLLYTIPKQPYASIIVLDGDKRQRAKEVVESYESLEKDRFQMVDTLDDFLKFSKDKVDAKKSLPCPVYCLKKNEIEDYLEPRPKQKELGPLFAYEMKRIPTEIEIIFGIVSRLAGLKPLPKRVEN